MARLQGVGQVAEWFKAAVLKTAPAHYQKRRFSRKSNDKWLRISRFSRPTHRIALAHMSAQMNGPQTVVEHRAALTKIAYEVQHG